MKLITAVLLVSAACLVLSCDSPATDTFSNGTYTGTVGQILAIDGDDFSYTVGVVTFAGGYVINGDAVTFTTTRVNGQNTGLNQRTTFDFTSTTNSITLTNMRDLENGGCGMAPDTFTK